MKIARAAHIAEQLALPLLALIERVEGVVQEPARDRLLGHDASPDLVDVRESPLEIAARDLERRHAK